MIGRIQKMTGTIQKDDREDKKMTDRIQKDNRGDTER